MYRGPINKFDEWWEEERGSSPEVLDQFVSDDDVDDMIEDDYSDEDCV